jgi:hypothetical protein
MSFRWRSWLGLSTALFFVNDIVFNFVPALLVPYALHSGGPASAPGLVVSNTADGALIGRDLATLGTSDPHLAAFFVTFMDSMCAFMMCFAVAALALTWFALRRGARWALVTLAISGFAQLPYYLVIAATYQANGVSALPDLGTFFAPVVIVLTIATISGWIAITRQQSPSLIKAGA